MKSLLITVTLIMGLSSLQPTMSAGFELASLDDYTRLVSNWTSNANQLNELEFSKLYGYISTWLFDIKKKNYQDNCLISLGLRTIERGWLLLLSARENTHMGEFVLESISDNECKFDNRELVCFLAVDVARENNKKSYPLSDIRAAKCTLKPKQSKLFDTEDNYDLEFGEFKSNKLTRELNATSVPNLNAIIFRWLSQLKADKSDDACVQGLGFESTRAVYVQTIDEELATLLIEVVVIPNDVCQAKAVGKQTPVCGIYGDLTRLDEDLISLGFFEFSYDKYKCAFLKSSPKAST